VVLLAVTMALIMATLQNILRNSFQHFQQNGDPAARAWHGTACRAGIQFNSA